MSKPVSPDLGIVLWFLRRGQDWSQAGLATAAGVSPTLLNDYEQGRKGFSRRRLELLISHMGLPLETIDATLERLHANRSAGSGRWAPGAASATLLRVEAVASRVGRLAAEFARSALSILAWEGEALLAREEARRLWAGHLERRTALQRVALVEEVPELQTWAVSELLAARSIEAAPASPAQALELAELALRAAELCRGEDWLRLRTRGYAGFHVANARRAANDLPGSDTALTAAKKLWEAGAAGDPGLFDEAIVLALEANIRKSQCRFPEALQQIEEALAADRGELRGKLLLTKAQILRFLGDIETSTEVLREAIPEIDETQEPRTALGVRCQFLGNLCLLDRAVEAAPHLGEVLVLADQLGQEVDQVRVVFLRGAIAAGTGRAEEAEEAFEQARHRFASFKPPLVFDYALVSLDLGLLLLEQNRTSEVQTLAEEMETIFTAQGVHREALAALMIFCEAAKREAATVELARRVIRFLHRSQHDPELKFDTAVEEAETL